MDQLKVSNYDLSCLGITACPPEDFQALIQLLINKICELNGLTPDDVKSGGCPDCVVSVAECFVQGTQTTMQLVDYVQMIANRVCSILAEIQVINDSITNLVNITNDLQFQIDNLPVYELPKITLTSCAIGSYAIGSQVSLDALINVFINNVWCPFYTATGTTSELLAAVAQKCVTDGTLQLSTGTPFGSNPNWIADANYNTVADAINNIWVVLCDLRAGFPRTVVAAGTGTTVTSSTVSNITTYTVSVAPSVPTVQDTTTINLTNTAGVLTADIQDTGWVELNGFDHYAPGVDKPQCRRIGNQVHFRGVVVIPLANNTGGLISYSSSSAYNAQFFNNVYTGSGGCTTSTNGSITFNNDISVIKTSVVDTLTNFDGTYTLGWVVATRQIDLNSLTYGTALSAVFNVGITSAKKLFVGVLKDLEFTNTRGNTPTNDPQLGSSHLRYITSNVRVGERVPVYTNSSSNIHSSNVPGVTPLEVNFDAALGTYPFSCNAGEEDQIGGFVFRLDGLIAYLDPCNSDIKNKVCP
jgi:hypothetical protein